MDPVKVGELIKKLRKSSNLTQAEFADKYGVTYQAVSKWENGINLPDIGLLKKISKDYDVSLDDLLEGSKTNNKKKGFFIILCVMFAFIITIISILYFGDNNEFKLKTISSDCDDFEVSGSLAYDKNKSSIYISDIIYCGDNKEVVYKSVECELYEIETDKNNKVATCKSGNDIDLDTYLKDVKLNIDNYVHDCNRFDRNSLYMEIKATDYNDKITYYKVPLVIGDNCPID